MLDVYVVSLPEWRERLQRVGLYLTRMHVLLGRALAIETLATTAPLSISNVAFPIDDQINGIFRDPACDAFVRMLEYLQPGKQIDLGNFPELYYRFRYKYDIYPGRPALFTHGNVDNDGDNGRITSNNGNPFAQVLEGDKVDVDYLDANGNHQVYESIVVTSTGLNVLEFDHTFSPVIDNTYVRITLIKVVESMTEYFVASLADWQNRLALASNCIGQMSTLLNHAEAIESAADGSTIEEPVIPAITNVGFPIDDQINNVFRDPVYNTYLRLLEYLQPGEQITSTAWWYHPFRYQYDIYPGRPYLFVNATVNNAGEDGHGRITANDGHPFQYVAVDDYCYVEWVVTELHYMAWIKVTKIGPEGADFGNYVEFDYTFNPTATNTYARVRLYKMVLAEA